MRIYSMSARAKILVLEDDTLVITSLKLLLKGHELTFFTCLPDFLETAPKACDYDLVLLDLCHPRDLTGAGTLAAFPELLLHVPNAEVVVQSGLKDIAIMRQCLQMGAKKFVLKDHIADEIPVFVENCLDRRHLRAELDQSIVGNSGAIVDLKNKLLELRHESQLVDVLIEGETGCGKELCAKALHREGPFVAINVAAIPSDLFEAELFGAEKGAYTGASGSREGYLESAAHGILFMDEIQSLPLALQAKLLRVLESRSYFRVGSTVERKFKGRVVSAANVPLLESVKKGLFREDLYYRLAATRVNIPPLRVRENDVSVLAQHFLKTLGSKNLQFTPEALQFLETQYDWPGNVRELKALVRQMASEAKMPFLDEPEVKNYIQKTETAVDQSVKAFQSKNPEAGNTYIPNLDFSFDDNVAAFEKYLISQSLKKLTSTQAREKLKLSRTRFYEKLKQYGIQTRQDLE